MANKESFPLHRCIFRNDVDSLNKNLKDEEIKKLINQKDNHGNTPIHLALMLDRRNCILSLLRNGCDVVSRNVFEWNPLEEATMLGDVDLIEKISKFKFRDYCLYFNKTGSDGTISKLDEWNKHLPYCYYKGQLKFKSKIPLLNKIGLKDVLQFYKNENSMRLDTGIVGFDLHGIPRIIHGSLSIIINRLDNGLSQIYMLDNKAKRYTELFPYIPQTVHDHFVKSRIDVKTLYKFFVDNSDLSIKKKTPSGFGFKSNKKRTIRINNKKYNTDLYKCKNISIVIRKRDNEQPIGDFISDIKTTVADIDKSRNKIHSSLTSELNNMIILDNKNIKGIDMDDIFKEENGDNDSESDSDSDDSDIENNDNDDKSVSSHGSSAEKLIEADNDFKKFIDENLYTLATVESEICDKVVQMIIKGQNEQGNAIEKSDIIYIDQILPTFYEAYLNSKRLSDDDQKKFEEIINTTVNSTKDKFGNKKKENNEYMQNFKKSENVSSMVHNLAENYYNSTSKKHNNTSNKFKNEEIKRVPISEEEYFDPSNTKSLHLGRKMEISEEKRRTKKALKFWLTKENSFPLNINDHLKPVIDFLCSLLYDQINGRLYDSNYDRSIYIKTIEYIFEQVEATKRFPLKFEVPVMASTALQFKLIDVNTDKKCVPDSKFKIPDNYIYDESVEFRFSR
ncbi:hypothetical protein BCR32DRAFT_298129 [Anaeromyces robustus]|uniref:Uncharacterized protein n=1 Tax=Anaeromyces robustus TaxID=1754192 RepID=A0A1Y1VSM3_9FUNG|nr:hypothetical protein BCR32DRAFT_298129 [Anaeromyces robustus]|eukprot:ORX64290.1 hypothetical protein BCR32DRAFT_298129 [Anaeromyces robustus]